jgi:hypothetical protein
MESSILKSVKKRLGIPDDYDVYDEDVLMNINTALSTLTQLGVGPEQGFVVQDDTATWEQLLGGDLRLNMVRDFVTLTSKLIFDPPPTSFGIQAVQKNLEEMAWRIEVAANPAPAATGNIDPVYMPGEL